MARANTITKLSLDDWARIMGIHPLHFNQVYVNAPTVCAQPWLQHEWQNSDRIGREAVARAIAQAEANIEAHLNYRLMPSWEIDEWRPTVRPWRPELINLSVTDVRGLRQVVTANWKHAISGGIRSKTLIAAGVSVVYSDVDSDSYAETATVTQIVTFPSACEVRAYLPGHAGADDFEIRPVAVSIDSGTGVATLTMRREQLVNPNLTSILEPDATGLIGTDDGNFETTIDVYRVYNDPQQQVQFLWEPFGGTCCSGSGCATCAYNVQLGCLMIREDPKHSMFSYIPATWNSTTLEFDSAAWSVLRQPDLVRLWYYAGFRDKALDCPTVEMSEDWKRVVAYYAAALLDRAICDCNNIRAWVENWRRDLAIPGEEGLRISEADLSNPFGTRRGAVNAWHRVKEAGTLEPAAVLT